VVHVVVLVFTCFMLIGVLVNVFVTATMPGQSSQHSKLRLW
jgi:hypothetical protein